MEIINTIAGLKEFTKPIKQNNKKIALVPTMGALHYGHISLIHLAQERSDVVICSIFVNPTQFTDPKDLEKYPRPLAHDIGMLEDAGCSAVFMPSVLEMYPKWPASEDWHIDLGPAEFLLEGAFRRGHYQGVTQIVKKLFDAATPDSAYFGQKDYQQVLMIKHMVALLNDPVEIVACPIIREPDGLAMSSRNIHLSPEDHVHALVLHKALLYVQQNYGTKEISMLLQEATNIIRQVPNVELDYFSIANADTLLPQENPSLGKSVALVAAKVGTTRLIDNIILNFAP